MKRHFILSVIVVLSIFTSYGAYLKNVPQTLTQPNGDVIHCFATGDEFYNWLHDSAGYTIVQDSLTGYFVYAVESNGDLLPTSHIVGKTNPQNLGLKPYANISSQKILEKRKSFESTLPARPVHKSGDVNHGHINNLVFFIRFADEADFGSYNNFYDDFELMHNDSSQGDATNSMYNYYKQISYGKFTVTTTFYPTSTNSVIYSYQDIYPRSYYLPYNSSTNPNGYPENERNSREQSLLRRVIDHFADSVPTSLNLDYNNDGNVDNICFIITGNSNIWRSLLWPHRSMLYGIPTPYINGKIAYDYNLIPIHGASTGTIVHEFMHTLGAPDLYRYDYSGSPVNVWDLMADTYDAVPQGMGVYVKHIYGNWVESIPEITSPGTYTLYPANGKSSDKIAYILRPDRSSNEYFVLEYRSKNSSIFDRDLPSSGLLIYRINAAFEGDGNGGYNGIDKFDEIYIYRPNGSPTSNGTPSNATFSANSNRTSFNLFTNPFPYSRYGTGIPGISISNISAVGDSIQFTIDEIVEELEVSTHDISLGCMLGHTKSFTLNSNTIWRISGDYAWLNVSNKDDKGDKTINLTTVLENTSTIARTCTLTVNTLSYELTKRIVVRQNPCGVGIEDADDIKTLAIYPNPAKDYLYIDCQNPDDIEQITVYSVTGQKIPIASAAKNNKIEFNIADLSAGIYYLKIDTKKQSVFRMFSVE